MRIHIPFFKKQAQNAHTVPTIQPTQTVQNEQRTQIAKHPPNLLQTQPITKIHNTNNNIDMSLIDAFKKLESLQDKTFVDFLKKLFSSSGFTAIDKPRPENGTARADLTIKKDGYTYIIEASGWNHTKTHHIKPEQVRTLVQVTAAYPNAQGVFITTSYFAAKAIKEGQKHSNIELIDLDGLIELIAHINPSLLSHAYRFMAVKTEVCPKPHCPGHKILYYNSETGKKFRKCCACEKYPK